jgi:hypothetical protein
MAERPSNPVKNPIPATAPLIPPPSQQAMKEPHPPALNLITILLAIILALFIYVNRSTIFPSSEEVGDVDMPAAMDVRPVVQIWEYRTERYYNSEQFKDGESVSVYGDEAKEQTSVRIDTEKLDAMGEGGWELVSTYLEMQTAFYNFGASDLHTGIKENVRPQAVVAIFKRPKR